MTPPAEQCAQNIADPLRYLARQPILDPHGKVHAYELLFRSGPESAFRGDGEFATRTMIDNTIIFGLEALTGGVPAFVNCTAEILTGQQVAVLPPSMTILEVLETVEPSPALIAACRRLKSMGFRIALDDFVWTPSLQPLVEVADYIKIDFIASDRAVRLATLERLRDRPVALIAEKVETAADYEQACSEGFTLFQGYYFCRPILLTKRKIPSNKLFHVQLLGALQKRPLDHHELGELVKVDAALTYRLLRLVNSPACAVRQEVSSIHIALMVVGDDVFRRIATLAIASELNAGQSDEILRMAFVRARFCELASALCGLDATEQYLLGLFSLLTAMLQAPIEAIVSALPLRPEVQQALLGQQNSASFLLQWVISSERADWERCDEIAKAHDLPPAPLQRCSAEAVQWTDQIMPIA